MERVVKEEKKLSSELFLIVPIRIPIFPLQKITPHSLSMLGSLFNDKHFFSPF